jgi:hypothetical protein
MQEQAHRVFVTADGVPQTSGPAAAGGKGAVMFQRREGNPRGKHTMEDRGRERVREHTGTDVEGVPETEDLDVADATHRLDLDSDEQKNATDPEHDPDEDAAG